MNPPVQRSRLSFVLLALSILALLFLDTIQAQTPTNITLRTYQVAQPSTMAVDSAKYLYVISTTNRVYKLDVDSSVLATFPANSTLSYATGLALDSRDNVYVSTLDGRTLVFDPSGALLRDMSILAYRLVIDQSDTLWACTYLAGGGGVYKYSTNGTLLRAYNNSITGIQQMDDCAHDPYNNILYVLDNALGAIVTIDTRPKAEPVTNITRFLNFTHNFEPYSLAADTFGNVFTLGYRPLKTVAKISANGNVRLLVPATGNFLEWPNVFADQKGCIYVSDYLGYVYVMSDLNPIRPSSSGAAGARTSRQ